MKTIAVVFLLTLASLALCWCVADAITQPPRGTRQREDDSK